MNHPTATCTICGLTFEARHSYGLCPLCLSKDRLLALDKLESAKRRASRANLPVTLTLVQWLSTVSDMRSLCAYCQEFTYYHIDMVDPDAGLTYENCVPACSSCMRHKREGFESALARVRAYLRSGRVAQLQLEPLTEEEAMEPMEHL